MERRPSFNLLSPFATTPTNFPPNLRRRLSTFSTPSNAEQENDTQATGEECAIQEEIAEIKRYEDFTTIDWVQDAAWEQVRRRARKDAVADLERKGLLGFRGKVRDTYDAAQGWIVVTIVGSLIGLNAAFLNIVTEWLSDMKLGYCTTAFYLNENFCCWGAESGCEEWHHWSSFWLVNYCLYIIFSGIFAFAVAFLVKSFAPYAAGSGISEIKCIIAGFVMKGFLGFRTLIIKSIGLPLSIASGLSVGKEGPSVHYAVCTGNIISRLFNKYRQNAAKTREILSASAAAGVGVAFGSPIGGVLFSLEEMSSSFPLKTMWRSYFCALVATAVLAGMNPFRTGQLVMFQVKYDRSWHFFEVIFFVVIGIFGGLYGALVIKWNLQAQAFRRKYLKNRFISEATILALITAVVCYPNKFLRIDMTESMEILFLECEGDHNYDRICESDRWPLITSLAFATLIRTVLVIISYGCKVPAGIFVPSMAIGACFGRMVGVFVQAILEAFPDLRLFAACEPDIPCITPGTYAFLGAGAALSGVMHITVSVVVIMFELTGALTYILPTMIVVGVTKAISNYFGKGGIADRMIWFNGFPFLDNKEEHIFGVPASQVMIDKLKTLYATGMELRELEQILSDSNFQGFPIVESRTSRILVSYIGRTELRFAIDRAKREDTAQPHAKCYFTSADVSEVANGTTSISFDTMAATSSQVSIDLSKFTDRTPITVHPGLALETVMDIFKKMGPRVILVERLGILEGLITVKDCLKYQFMNESGLQSGIKDDPREERLWNMIEKSVIWLGDFLSKLTYGRVRFGYRNSNLGGWQQADLMEALQSSPPNHTSPRESSSQNLELEDRDQVASRPL